MSKFVSRFQLPTRLLAGIMFAGSANCGPSVAHAEQAAVAPAADPHAAHRHMMANTEVRRSVASYVVPSLSMVRDDGVSVSLDKELNDGRPVVVSFIFTSCTTICPLTSQVISMLQSKLGEDRDRVHLVSISIDPEQDTPPRLRDYAARFEAGASWQHYTGTLNASIAAQQAFNVYRGDKTNHTPVTLVRAASGNSWVRLEGFVTADSLLSELHSPKTASRQVDIAR
jgi:protein SCO1/2